MQLLRRAVREEMGLKEKDMLDIALSSTNAEKGQLLFVESAHSIIAEQSQTALDPSLSDKLRLGSLHQKIRSYGNTRRLSDYLQPLDAPTDGIHIHNSSNQNLKILIGSVGSKSNKVVYVKEIIRFLSENPNLPNSVLWTPAVTCVASLYSAADVYVTNSQG